VLSARYAGPDASDADRIRNCWAKCAGKSGQDREARFVALWPWPNLEARAGCVFGFGARRAFGRAARTGRIRVTIPFFYFPALEKHMRKYLARKKNLYSHRGKAFHNALNFLLNAR